MQRTVQTIYRTIRYVYNMRDIWIYICYFQKSLICWNSQKYSVWVKKKNSLAKCPLSREIRWMGQPRMFHAWASTQYVVHVLKYSRCVFVSSHLWQPECNTIINCHFRFPYKLRYFEMTLLTQIWFFMLLFLALKNNLVLFWRREYSLNGQTVAVSRLVSLVSYSIIYWP